MVHKATTGREGSTSPASPNLGLSTTISRKKSAADKKHKSEKLSRAVTISPEDTPNDESLAVDNKSVAGSKEKRMAR